MARVLHGLEWKVCVMYIGDIIIFSCIFEEHLSWLSLVFDCLRQAKLKLKPSKCHFTQTSVTFLGFVVSSKGILPNLDKLSAVKSFPVPKCVKDVHSFLGHCNCYCRFVGFAKIALPLHHLTRKDVAFAWSPECETAFISHKDRLCSPPHLPRCWMSIPPLYRCQPKHLRIWFSQSKTQLVQQRMKQQYDKTALPVPFDVGNKVWVLKSCKGLSKKLSNNFDGPYRIVTKLSPVHFRLQTLDNRPVSVPVHANRIKLYCDHPIDQ